VKSPAKSDQKKEAERLYNISYSDTMSMATWACLMQPQKKIGVGPSRNYEELSPADLMESLHLERAVINQEEFSRAEWFWNRRPKVLFEKLILLFCYTIIFVCLLYGVPESCPLLFFWTVAGASCALAGWFRLDRWRNEYQSSIRRALFPSRKADRQG
jgi:hypothetical protein